MRRILSFAADFAAELVHEKLVEVGRRKLGILAMEERLRELEERDAILSRRVDLANGRSSRRPMVPGRRPA